MRLQVSKQLVILEHSNIKKFNMDKESKEGINLKVSPFYFANEKLNFL